MIRSLRSTRTAWYIGARFLSSAKKNLYSIPDIPDNAPTLQENTEWLKRLRRDEDTDDQADDDAMNLTYIVTEKTALEDPEINENYIRFKSKKTKRTHTVVEQPTESNRYHTVSVLASDFFISSSPFSSMNSRRRPKAESVQPFSDLKVVKLKSGKGGNGEISFYRDTGIAVGPPDGGDGGAGGDIYVMAVNDLN